MRKDGIEIARLLNLSDSVFAVAMTFLAFTIGLPRPTNQASLPDQLISLLPQLFALSFSYFVVARVWLVHHRIFRHMSSGHAMLAVVEFVLLFWVVILPFSADLLGTWPLQFLTVIIYATNAAAIGITQLVAIRHAMHHHLPDSKLGDLRILLFQIELLPAVFVVSMPISWFNPRIAVLSWVSLLPLQFLLPHAIPQK